MMNFNNLNDNFISVFDSLFQFLQIDHVFMAEIPESSLNATEDMNILVSLTGNVEGNIMFCHSKGVAESICQKITGCKKVDNVDFYVIAALADFYSEFSKKFINLIKSEATALKNDEEKANNDFILHSSCPTYISGKKLNGVISKVPSKKLFFKVNNERFCIAYSIM